MKCSNCGFEDEGKFCSNCGSLLAAPPAIKANLSAKVDPGEWEVCISFGKSSSANFDRAIYLAKAAPKYIETVDEVGNVAHQSFFGKEQCLQFIALYELIGNWKSCFVFINNEMVDRKIIGNINYCYGDKLRSGNPQFCYGASEWTENPFGCHRPQMHRGRDPWYTFGMMDTTGIFHVDVDKIVKELQIRLSPYKYCPSLNFEDILDKASRLPRTINPKKQTDWEYTTHYHSDGSQTQGVQPKSHSMSYEIQVSLEDILESQKTKEALAGGKESKQKTGGLLSRLFGR